MDLTVYSMEKKKVGEVAWPEAFKSNAARIYQVVVQQRTNERQGNARVKNRHEVSGSTRKIYRQKGTGRARHGDIKAPLFVGGGRAFGPKPRDWHSTLPEKIRQGAVRDLVSLKHEEKKLWLIDTLELPEPKTKKMAAFFAKFEIPSGLLVLAKRNPTVEKSVRNLAKFKVAPVDSLRALDLLRYEHLVVTREAYDEILKRYA